MMITKIIKVKHYNLFKQDLDANGRKGTLSRYTFLARKMSQNFDQAIKTLDRAGLYILLAIESNRHNREAIIDVIRTTPGYPTDALLLRNVMSSDRSQSYVKKHAKEAYVELSAKQYTKDTHTQLDDVVEIVSQIMNSADEQSWQNAVNLIRTINNGRGYLYLMLKNEPNRKKREFILETLKKTTRKSTINSDIAILTDIMKTDKSTKVKAQSVKALTSLGVRGLEAIIDNIALSENDPDNLIVVLHNYLRNTGKSKDMNEKASVTRDLKTLKLQYEDNGRFLKMNLVDGLILILKTSAG